MERNAWRRETPGATDWGSSITPGAADKWFIVSADAHANEPGSYLYDYVAAEHHGRLPHVETRADGSEWMVTEGNRPQLMKAAPSKGGSRGGTAGSAPMSGASPMEDEDNRRNASGRELQQRLDDQRADGVDVEWIFPNKGLLCWATPDPTFAGVMCRAWNRWAFDAFDGAGGWNANRTLPFASIAAGDVDDALAEIEWAAANGWKGLCFGNSPIYGPKEWGRLEYNDPGFERIWSLVAETGLPVTFHVSTGRDPRAVGGGGGAITNYVCHSMETTIEPLVQLISSGVFERHPALRAGMVESGIGFLPWLLETMDYAYKAHHFWVRPKLAKLPSEYFRSNCFATFQEDHVGLRHVEDDDLVGNVLWANDYPHHEGSWPHSKASIERQMSHLSEVSRRAILGGNAATLLGLDAASVRAA
jgi:predicted TIM-barrel fold metal-dependent hydrolase